MADTFKVKDNLLFCLPLCILVFTWTLSFEHSLISSPFTDALKHIFKVIKFLFLLETQISPACFLMLLYLRLYQQQMWVFIRLRETGDFRIASESLHSIKSQSRLKGSLSEIMISRNHDDLFKPELYFLKLEIERKRALEKKCIQMNS